jgi:hypothetical protein
MDVYAFRAEQHFAKLKRLYEQGSSCTDEAIRHHRALTEVLTSAAADPTSSDAPRLKPLMEKADKMLEEMKLRPAQPGDQAGHSPPGSSK